MKNTRYERSALGRTKDDLRALLASLPKPLREAKTGYYMPGTAYVYAKAPRRQSAARDALNSQQH